MDNEADGMCNSSQSKAKEKRKSAKTPAETKPCRRSTRRRTKPEDVISDAVQCSGLSKAERTKSFKNNNSSENNEAVIPIKSDSSEEMTPSNTDYKIEDIPSPQGERDDQLSKTGTSDSMPVDDKSADETPKSNISKGNECDISEDTTVEGLEISEAENKRSRGSSINSRESDKGSPPNADEGRLTEDTSWRRESHANKLDDTTVPSEDTQLKNTSQNSRLSGRRLSKIESKENDNCTEKPTRKRKWGSSTKNAVGASLSISTDALKDLIPDVSTGSRSQIVEIAEQNSVSEEKQGRKSKSTTPKPPCSPSKNPLSCILFIRNLVRPFTVNNLKNMLLSFGNTVDEEFWIDKIKSKCFVTYESEDVAAAAREALHNSRWPSSNPKTLLVDFSNKLERDRQKDMVSVPPLLAATSAVPRKSEFPAAKAEPAEKRLEVSPKKERLFTVPIREWDMDKIVQESPEHKEKPREKERHRSTEKKKDKKESRKKLEEDTPSKLLDDLFRKTKTTPCIYWLPLTEEQIVQKEEEKKKRQLEKEKQRQLRKQEEEDRKKKGDRESKRSWSRSPVRRR